MVVGRVSANAFGFNALAGVRGFGAFGQRAQAVLGLVCFNALAGVRGFGGNTVLCHRWRC